MTFTEAAVEVLRRAGKPLHFKHIAEQAVRENLLSHVGQDPEITMGQRLAAMAKREDDRKVVAIAPEGTFALTEWSVPAEAVVEAKAPPLVPEGAELEKPYRGREREPRPINVQARRRMEVLAGHETEAGSDETEREHHRRERGAGGQRRFPPPAEVLFEALALRQSGAPLAELAGELHGKGMLSDALVRDLPSLTAALLEDNRRRTEAGRKPAFIVDGERVTLVEFPPPSAIAEEKERAPQTGLGRPPTSAALVAEYRRATVRALRRRLSDLETSGFEHVCAALLEKMGMRDVRVAKRSKEGPLYLARQRRGVSDLRVAVRLVRGAREIARADVQELRKDLAHYSAQMGLVLAAGEAGREARSEGSAAGQAPVALYVGEALAEELVALRVGVAVQTVEIADVDEAFFAAAGKAAPGHRPEADPRRERPPREGREGREVREPRERGEGHPPEEGVAAASPDESSEVRAEGKPSAVPFAATEASPAEAPKDAPQVAASAEALSDAEPAASADQAELLEAERSRRRGRRGERTEPATPARITSPADQAWGQPAGTPRRAVPPPFALERPETRAVEGAEAAEAAPSPEAADAAATDGKRQATPDGDAVPHEPAAQPPSGDEPPPGGTSNGPT